MERFYKRFVNEVVDENGMLKDITFNIPEDFNYGFDVVDAIAKKTPDKNHANRCFITLPSFYSSASCVKSIRARKSVSARPWPPGRRSV